jgi:hypothetical protein
MKNYLLLLLFSLLLTRASVAQAPATPKVSKPDFIYRTDKAVIECTILAENSQEISYRLLTDAPNKVRAIRRIAVERIERSQQAAAVAAPATAIPPSPSPQQQISVNKTKQKKQYAGTATMPKVTLYGIVGPSAAYPFGREIDTLRKQLQQPSGDSAHRFKGSIWPRFTLHTGLLVSIRLNPSFRFTTGILYTQRGLTYTRQDNYRHPEVQYDTRLTTKNQYRIDVLDVSAEINWQISRKWQWGLGIGIAAAFSDHNAKQIAKSQYKVTTNGKTDREESTPKERDEYPLWESTTKIVPSAQMSVLYSFQPHWHVRLNTQATYNLFNTGSQVKNAVVHLGILYSINLPSRL